MRAQIGKDGDPWTYEVTTTSVRMYARGIGSDDPIHYDVDLRRAGVGVRGRDVTRPWSRRRYRVRFGAGGPMAGRGVTRDSTVRPGSRAAVIIDDAGPDEARAIAAMQTRVADDLTRRYGRGHWSAAVTESSVLRAMGASRVLVARYGDTLAGTLRLVTKKPWAIDPGVLPRGPAAALPVEHGGRTGAPAHRHRPRAARGGR